MFVNILTYVYLLIFMQIKCFPIIFISFQWIIFFWKPALNPETTPTRSIPQEGLKANWQTRIQNIDPLAEGLRYERRWLYLFRIDFLLNMRLFTMRHPRYSSSTLCLLVSAYFLFGKGEFSNVFLICHRHLFRVRRIGDCKDWQLRYGPLLYCGILKYLFTTDNTSIKY